MPMRRSLGNPSLWGITLMLPVGVLPDFRYSYFIVDQDQAVWREATSMRALPANKIPNSALSLSDSKEILVEQEDTLDHAECQAQS